MSALKTLSEILNGVNKYGMLTVISEAPRVKEKSGYEKRMLNVLCDCGKEKVIGLWQVINKGTISCGCAQRKKASEFMSKMSFKHGHANTSKQSREYIAWQRMRTRCKNPAAAEYCYYGGKGITVCERWDDFLNFLKDMGPRPLNQTLDRIDPNGNYEPNNCRWATAEIQANNKTNNKFVVLNGEKMTIAQACRKTGMPRHIAYSRLKSGYSAEQSFYVPIGELKPWHKGESG